METDPVHFFTQLKKSPGQILRSRGVFNARGEKARRPGRADFQAALSAHKGSTDWVRFERLDLSGVDLRGLDLRRISFVGCNLTHADASPIVIAGDQEFDDRDVDDGYINGVLDRWERGEVDQLIREGITVEPTKLNHSLLYGANLSGANFNFAVMENCRLREVWAEETKFYKANLKRADLRFGRFRRADFRRADLTDANLLEAELDTNYLDGILWGEKQGIHQERLANISDRPQKRREEDLREAVEVYRLLARSHERADMNEMAGEFRYRRNRAETKMLMERVAKVDPTPSLFTLGWWSGVLRQRNFRDLSGWLLRTIWNLLCGFGERPWRPACSILIVIFGFMPFYFEPTGWNFTLAGALEFAERMGRAVYFSAASTTALGYGSWAGQGLGPAKYLGALQSLLGLLLSALLVVTVSRRWMR